MGATPAAASVLPGPNGPLVFTSGRDDGTTVLSDNHAQIWFLNAPGGGASRLTSLSLSHHRHASWSPDRTKIAYARGPDDGNPFDGPWDIYVDDLSDPTSAPVNITNTLSLNEDRPSWSPDGTRIAYAKESAATMWDIVTKAPSAAAPETTVAEDASAGAGSSGQFSRPQWSADGQSIFYGKIISPSPQDYDIYRAAANGSDHILGGTAVVSGTTENDYQPAMSADGTKLCFTRQDATNGKDVLIVPSEGGLAVPLLVTNGVNEYECAWSPDGTKIAFVRGAFGAGEILMKSLDVSGTVDTVTDVAGRFDGNPEWTRNPPPTCSNGNASVAFNGFVKIPLSCADDRDPPIYEDNPPELQIASGPLNGTLGGIQPDRSVIYTPKANFQGTDSFTFTGNDQTTTSAPASVTVTVGGPGSDVTPADITALSVFPRRWRRGSELPSFSASLGMRVRWQLSEAARVTITFQRARLGRRVGGRCLPPTRARRGRPRCTRFVRAGRLSRPNAKAGVNTLRFQGQLTRSRRLRLGAYRLVVGAVDAAGNRSKSRTSRTFRIVAR
jgi:Tol biopolymer transport system component